MIKPSDFMSWEHAVWAWSDLKTIEALDKEWDKVEKPYSSWEKLYKKRPAEALKQLATHNDADLIKRGHDLHLLYRWWADKRTRSQLHFWQVYEPSCYEGGAIHGGFSARKGFVQDDMWAKANIFTGKCDWPDWRTPKEKASDIKSKARYMKRVKYRIEMSK